MLSSANSNMIYHSSPWINDEDTTAVTEVLTSGNLVKGKRGAELEALLSQYFGAVGARVTGSGTDALVLALDALDVRPGDEVILPTYVCKSVELAVELVGATPVLCDVGDNWLMTRERVKLKITDKTKAIILVHIFGIAANTSEFMDLGIPVIDDCCQAFGASFDNDKCGTKAHIGVFSFHATKCLTTGEGGAIVTRDKELAARIDSQIATRKFNTSMTDLQAALGVSQLKRYDDFLSKRKQIAEAYFSGIKSEYTTKFRAVADQSMFFRFPLTIDQDYDLIREKMEGRGVAIRKGVDALLHRNIGQGDDGFESAVRHFNTTISVPILPFMTSEQVINVINSINDL
jgi:perosamine synthetase